MNKTLKLASAGAGKTCDIVNFALKKSNQGKTILILTYTQRNQEKLLKTICEKNKFKPSNIVIKGWFTFLLEDMIRPYQRCIFKNRIPNCHLNSSDPHKKNGKTICGRKEKLNKKYNPLYYLTKSSNKAHTTYLAKLATRIYKESKRKSTKRLREIYDFVFIDEVQDLIGWDFNIVQAMSKSDHLGFVCVGDFRQTIYSTAHTQKEPKLANKKLKQFKQLGFELEEMNYSWRSVQSICDFADLVHASEKYLSTYSKVKVDKISAQFQEHQGIFVVTKNLVIEYVAQYKPVILRYNKTVEIKLCEGRECYNFGESKGLDFDRVLIIPTKEYMDFLSGKQGVFKAGKTEEAKNKLYVAITRAKYSVAFLYDGEVLLDGVKIWTNKAYKQMKVNGITIKQKKLCFI